MKPRRGDVLEKDGVTRTVLRLEDMRGNILYGGCRVKHVFFRTSSGFEVKAPIKAWWDWAVEAEVTHKQGPGAQ